MARKLRIAIDGPVASGKGDIAARLARKFDLVYIYTGAMYRALALACIEAGVSTKDCRGVIDILSKAKIELKNPSSKSNLSFSAWLNGRDVSERITQQDTAMGASDVGVCPEVRKAMVDKQKQMARLDRVVMEGRDIALRVMPDADFKIFLTASQAERAARRQKDLKRQGVNRDFEEILKDTQARDIQDSTRKVDPLTKTQDAWDCDTTGINQEAVIEKITKELRKRNLL